MQKNGIVKAWASASALSLHVFIALIDRHLKVGKYFVTYYQTTIKRDTQTSAKAFATVIFWTRVLYSIIIVDQWAKWWWCGEWWSWSPSSFWLLMINDDGLRMYICCLCMQERTFGACWHKLVTQNVVNPSCIWTLRKGSFMSCLWLSSWKCLQNIKIHCMRSKKTLLIS